MYDAPIGPLPTHRILSVEEAERQAKELMEAITRTNEQAVPPGNRPHPDDAKPLGYIILTSQADGSWKDDWDGEVHETRQAVLEELRRA